MAARLARLLLALALLAGWQLALVHPLKHFDAKGGFVHLAGGQSQDRKSSSTDGLCDAIAALAACVPETATHVPPPCCGHGVPASFDQGLRLAAAAPPFLSQGPPASP
ncbi:MAG: hypothetical protein ACREUH_10715 [Burkholderiales bacterium]